MFANPSISSVPRPSRRSARVVAGIAASVATVVLLAPAGALASKAAAPQCPPAPLSQPFSPWGDSSEYQLVSGGDFESQGAGWKLQHGASIVAGSEPFAATGSAGSHSLDLPAGASAESPQICVTAAYPTMRMFAVANSIGSVVLVQVVYDGGLLGSQPIGVGAIVAGGSWAPTSLLTTLAQVGASNGGSAEVSLLFTALTGNTQLDDVFIDPRLTY